MSERSKTPSNHPRRTKARGLLGRAATGLGALSLLGLGILGFPSESSARLDPFYIVHGQSYGTVTPRILFVLDTSGSMAFEQPWPDALCAWGNCEDEGAGSKRSRVHVARNVMRKIAAANEGTADFALMSFGMAEPPKSSGQVPRKCYSWDWNGWYRFTWVAYSNQPSLNTWSPLYNMFGTQGAWMLCGDNRPFAYLRHDDLGAFSMPNNSDEELAEEPLYKQKSNASGYSSGDNYSRKVQYFPRYIGRRANLDCSDPQQAAIVHGSYGDWGNSNSSRNAKVCGRDFYYWPYVDGFPGYSFNVGYSLNSMWHEECDDDNECWGTSSEQHRIGATRRNQAQGATLFAPFYSEAVLADNDISAADKGPLSRDDAALVFDGLTSESYAGGLDVSGGTPWAFAIGNLDWMITHNGGNIALKNAVPLSNGAFSHTTVASYLAFLTVNNEDDVCRPTAVILVTDGQPTPWWKHGGTKLFSRVSKFRKRLGVKTYLVGFSSGSWNDPLKWERMHQFACAAAGSEDEFSPCMGSNDHDWDTCADPSDPVNGCAWLAGNDDELAAALSAIIDDVIDTDVPSGSPTVANDFQAADLNDPEGDQAAVQTSIAAFTESPAWLGHVTRAGCSDEDPENPGELSEYCASAAILAVDTEEVETFGPCPIGRIWDAGECLQMTDASERRLYTHDLDDDLVRIAYEGEATPAFTNLVVALDAQGKIDPPLTPGSESAEVQAMVDLLLGVDGVEGWKLPGIANSAPVLVRRVPQQNSDFQPSVGIRDAHCAGRRNVIGDDVPETLKSFSNAAWELSSGSGFDDHYDYAEAVLVGDDFGLLHAFHYNSGNELFGFLPLALINNARVLSLNGPAGFGQPEGFEDHIYGVASTVNAGWVFDEDKQLWRHLAVFGLGPGGAEIIVLDVSHMGRMQDDDPVEVLWTSSTTDIAGEYAATLGETWSRPALTYGVPNNEMSLTPKGYLVFGSGYREGVGDEYRGRTVWVVDALTGDTVTDRAYTPAILDGTTYDLADDVTTVGDIAVGSHCLSRYWAEMQEAYFADPAGRLFRWDLATGVGDVTSFPHVADSGGKWETNGDGFAIANPAFRFSACQDEDEFSCEVDPIGGQSKGDVFTFSPAIAANNRIDQVDSAGELLSLAQRDQFLIALASGSPNDASVDAGKDGADFHSSIYLIADDHRVDSEGGMDIPGDGALTGPGSHPHFMRLALNQIVRSRSVDYPDGTSEIETRPFSIRARPIRAPLIRVTGVADGGVQVPGEVFYITYTIYEPADSTCDSRWYNDDTDEWVFDQGATYEVGFRLGVEDGSPFDFQTNYSLPGDPGDGFGASGSLSAPVVRQVIEDCDDGNCGAVLKAPKTSPCDPNVDAPPAGSLTSIQTGWSELTGFSPLEVPL